MKIAKILTYKGQDYKYVIDTEPASYCDICVFRDMCADVITGKIAPENSPMPLCNELSEEFNTHFACFTK